MIIIVIFITTFCLSILPGYADAVPVWRLSTSNADHYYTADCNLAFDTQKTYRYNIDFGGAPVFYLQLKQETGTIPLYRFFSRYWNKHIYTKNPAEGTGDSAEGIVGFVYATPTNGLVPLYRLTQPDPGSFMFPKRPKWISDNFLTTDERERQEVIRTRGFKDAGILGYVSRSGANPSCNPVYKPDFLHAETQVDTSRFLYVDATARAIHIKVSNGWRMDPWHVVAHVHFFSKGKEWARFNAHVWCAASLGGGAKECDSYYLNNSYLLDHVDQMTVSGTNEENRRDNPPPNWSTTFDAP
jgi:Repeat of unknown function (DUF5648)